MKSRETAVPGQRILTFFIERYVLLFLILFCALGSGGCKAATAESSTDEKRDTSNKAALSKARENIENYRKASFQVKILDANGRPVPRASIIVKQVSHSFKFGCYLKIDDLPPEKLSAYKLRFKQLFNYAVIGTYWDFIENRKGDENWAWFDREVALANEMGIDAGAAPVLWGTNDFGTPRWLPGREDELLPVLERRVRSAVTRNSYIKDWEIVNEPLARKEDLFAQRIKGGYIDHAYRWARESAPGKRLLINEYGVFGSLKDHNYNSGRYFELIDRLAGKGTPIDVIGIQAHANGEWYEPTNVADQLERYSKLGKPLQISEFSVQTRDFKDRKALEISGGYRSGSWDANKQAEFYREFYTVAFGSPRVEAIVTWGLDEERAWLPGIGLINRNGEPTSAFDALDSLINHEWKTRLEGTTDKGGTYEFRGFLGNYEVTITGPAGRIAAAKFTLGADNAEPLFIRLGV